MMHRNPMIPVFDASQPIVVASRFRGGGRVREANEVFDGAGISPEVLRDLAAAGYIRNGVPRVREVDAALTEKRRAEFEVQTATKAAEKARKEAAIADKQAVAARAKRVAAAMRTGQE